MDGTAVRALHDGHEVAQIALHAGDELDIVLLGRAEGSREGLRRAMVGDGDGGVSPLGGLLDQAARVGHAVHGGHVGVHVQFDALFLGRILALGLGHLLHIAHAHAELA